MFALAPVLDPGNPEVGIFDEVGLGNDGIVGLGFAFIAPVFIGGIVGLGAVPVLLEAGGTIGLGCKLVPVNPGVEFAIGRTLEPENEGCILG